MINPETVARIGPSPAHSIRRRARIRVARGNRPGKGLPPIAVACPWSALRTEPVFAKLFKVVFPLLLEPSMAANHPSDDDAELLLRDAAGGDAVALRKLLGRHRDRLRRMVALRLTSRLAVRVDPSDVVHEAFVEAETRLGDYLRDRPMPLYPWLHRLAAERLQATCRRLMPTEAGDSPLEASNTFITTAATHLRGADVQFQAVTASGPAMLREESHRRMRIALEGLQPPDREVMVLHYLEELDFTDMAAILDLDLPTVKRRHLQALQRLSALIAVIGRDLGGGP